MVKEIKEGYLGLTICRTAPSTGPSPLRSWGLDLTYTVDLPPACLVFPSDEMGEGGDGVGGGHARDGSTGQVRESEGMVACGDGEEGTTWHRGWIWIRVGRKGERENVMREREGQGRHAGVVRLVVAHVGEPRYH